MFRSLFFLLIFLLGSNLLQASFDTDSQEFLDPYNRPETMQESVDRTFKKLSRAKPGAEWNYNGSSSYTILGMDTKRFLDTLVKTAPAEQSEFYILDMGSGDGSWGRSLITYINQQNDLYSDYIFQIFNLTGDGYEDQIIEEGRCTLYNFGSFPLENIGSALPERLLTYGLESDIQFDLIVSKYTFVHFHDPVGTWGQTFNLLRPKTGHMLMDGLNVYFSGKAELSTYYTSLMFLNMLKHPFLTGNYGVDRMPNQFLLRRPDEKPVRIPLKYAGSSYERPANAEAKSIATFEITSADYDDVVVVPDYTHGNDYFGDKGLYEWMVANHQPWIEKDTAWRSLADSSVREERLSDSIFAVIARKDSNRFKELLAQGIDVYQENALGLSVADQLRYYGNLEMLKVLLEQDIPLEASLIKKILDNSRTIRDLDVETFEEIVKKGLLGINDFLNEEEKCTVLHKAIRVKNIELVEYLLSQGEIDPSIKDEKGRTAFDLSAAKKKPIKIIINAYKKRVG